MHDRASSGQDRAWVLNVLHDQARIPHCPSSSTICPPASFLHTNQTPVPRSHGPTPASGPLHHSSSVWDALLPASFSMSGSRSCLPRRAQLTWSKGPPTPPPSSLTLYLLHFLLNSYQHLSPNICVYFLIYNVRVGTWSCPVIFPVWHIVGTCRYVWTAQ